MKTTHDHLLGLSNEKYLAHLHQPGDEFSLTDPKLKKHRYRITRIDDNGTVVAIDINEKYGNRVSKPTVYAFLYGISELQQRGAIRWHILAGKPVERSEGRQTAKKLLMATAALEFIPTGANVPYTIADGLEFTK